MTQQVTLVSLALAAAIAGAVLFFVLSSGSASAQDQAPDQGLSLITDTPDEGYALAVGLARRGVGTTQPDREVLFSLREDYATDPELLIASSQVIAIHFQTIAEANGHWR
ncbi:MAG: hexameric tyrosine-coordinated heme protein [Pseudomonadota bacterium]